MAANQSNQREKEVFERALDLEADEERLGYVKGACADDAALLIRVQALLQAHDETVNVRCPQQWAKKMQTKHSTTE